MRSTEHLLDHFGSLTDMVASSTGTIRTNIPFCAPPCECADCQTYYCSLEEQRIDRFHYVEVLTDGDARTILAKHTNDINSARAEA